MSNSYTKEIIEDVAAELGLSNPSFVEKDIFVTQIIQVLTDIENENFNLIFTGGTCLAKAHRLIQRMSEDIDFKIINKVPEKSYSQSQQKIRYKNFREEIFQKLQIEKFNIINNESCDGYKYFKVELDYPSLFDIKSDNLRPHILLEFTASEIFEEIIELPIQTLVDDFIEEKNKTTKIVKCSAFVETGAEKIIALVRRVASISHGYEDMDPRLIRHLHDISIIDKQHPLSDSQSFIEIVGKIVERDRKKYIRHKEFQDNPIAEIEYSLSILKNNKDWKERYNNFVSEMVYGENIPSYKKSLECICKLFELIFNQDNKY